MSEGLGPLPAPHRAGDLKPDTQVYTADALWFYAAAEKLAERERCAQVCESEARMHSHGDVTGRGAGSDRADVARTCAAAIRKPANAGGNRVTPMTNDRTAAEVPGGTPVERPVVRLVPERVVQARAMPPSEQPWLAAGASLVATRESILAAMRDLHDNATDTVWLTPHETVFERLASIYGYAGGDPATLAAMWPEYFA